MKAIKTCLPAIVCPSRALDARHKLLKNNALDHYPGDFAVIVVTIIVGPFRQYLDARKKRAMRPAE
jgi:hypothetical protein